MKNISVFVVIAFVTMLSSCVYHYNFSGLKADAAIDMFGDGVYMEKILHEEKEVVLNSLALQGKSKSEIKNFVGYTMTGGIIYFYIDTRTLASGLTDEMIAEVKNFQKEWLAGEYTMYDRKTAPIWLVYGEDEEDMLAINGYYRGKGWHIFQLGDEEKRYFDSEEDLAKVDFFQYIPLFVYRPTING